MLKKGEGEKTYGNEGSLNMGGWLSRQIKGHSTMRNLGGESTESRKHLKKLERKKRLCQ